MKKNITIFFMLITLGCSNSYNTSNASSYYLCDNLVRDMDTIQILCNDNDKYSEKTYVNNELDTLQCRITYQDSCQIVGSRYISQIHFELYQTGVLIPEVYFIPISDSIVHHDIYMQTVNRTLNDSSKKTQFYLNNEYICGAKINFNESGDYTWFLDVYTHDLCSELIIQSIDSFNFTIKK